MNARRHRGLGIVALLLLAPIAAELLSAYLGAIGSPLQVVGFVMFLAPLYGGAGLLIREVAVRAGWGWSGRLLLAGAFGLAMTTLIDGSLFTPRSDVEGWSLIQSSAHAFGISWFALAIWVLGHVALSIAAPLAIAEGLAREPGPWLNGVGIGVVAVAFLAVAGAIHADNADLIAYDTAGVVLSILGILALIALAVGPWGRPLRPARRHVAPRSPAPGWRTSRPHRVGAQA